MLLVKPSMFGKLEVHVLEVVWRFEPVTFYIRELRVKLILASHALLKFGLRSTNFWTSILQKITIDYSI